MDAKRGSSEQGPAPDPGGAGVERYGPLALLRLHKEDGRGVIVYERVERSAADHQPAGEAAPMTGNPPMRRAGG